MTSKRFIDASYENIDDLIKELQTYPLETPVFIQPYDDADPIMFGFINSMFVGLDDEGTEHFTYDEKEFKADFEYKKCIVLYDLS